MAFTVGELASIANAALDFYIKDQPFSQTIQEKPLLSIMDKKAKNFPGGKGDISLPIKAAYGAAGVNDTLVGYTHDDSANFYTPANILRAKYAWREHHIGLTLTHTELKIDGLSVTDSAFGDKTSEHSGREMHALVDLLKDKLEDFGEQYSRSLNSLLWGDGIADAKALHGLRHFIAANPTTGTVGGINRATAGNEYWRNLAYTAAHAGAGGTGAITSNTANGGALIQELSKMYRQLTRYGGKPDTFIAGSDFIDAMEREMRANGNYSDNGFSQGGDVSIGGLRYKNVPIQYDPTLDSLSLAKRAYWFDSRHIYLMKMENEWNKQHTPARPFNKFVLYRSVTSTGQVVAKQLNSAVVIDIT